MFSSFGLKHVIVISINFTSSVYVNLLKDVTFLTVSTFAVVVGYRLHPVSYTHLDVYKRQAKDLLFLVKIG